MEYTALIFDDCQDETDSYENLVDTINVYKNDPMCKQIVVSCTAEWLLRLAHSPISKVLLVQMARYPKNLEQSFSIPCNLYEQRFTGI